MFVENGKHSFQKTKWIYIGLFCVVSLFACRPPDQGAGKIGTVKKWGVFVGDRVQSTPAVASDGSIYVGSSDQHLYAYTNNGRRRWRFKSKGHALSPTIAHDGSIVFTSSEGYLTVLEPDGRQRWQKQPRQKLAGCPPAISKTGIVFTSGDLIMVAYRLKDGKDYVVGKKLPLVKTCPVLDRHDTLYFGGSKKKTEMLYAYDVKKGSQKWSYPVGSAFSIPSFDNQGNLYIGTQDGRVISLTPKGKKRWVFQAKAVKQLRKTDPPAGFWRPVVSPKGHLVVTRAQVGLYSLSLQGKQRWMVPQELRSFSRHVQIANDGFIYVGSHDQFIYAFTPEGKRHYRFLTNARVLFGASFSHDQKTLYIGSFDKHLYALHTHKKKIK